MLGVPIGGVPDNESGSHTRGCVLTQRGPYYGEVCTYQGIFTWNFVMIIVHYLVGEVTALKEGPLFQEWVYVSKGRCVPINLLNKMNTLHFGSPYWGNTASTFSLHLCGLKCFE